MTDIKKKLRTTDGFDGVKNLMPNSSMPKKIATPPKQENAVIAYSARSGSFKVAEASPKKPYTPAKKKPKK